MRVNTQFTVAVHILAVLVFFKDDPPPSENIAGSVGTNPVVVRRILAQLKKAGILSTRSGVKGAVLCQKPEDIRLLDIYHAVRPPDESLFDMHKKPYAKCPVGAYITEVLQEPLGAVEQAFEKELASFTLQDILVPMSEKNGMPL